MKSARYNFTRETKFAKSLYRDLSKYVLRALKELIQRHQISVAGGDVKYFDGGWYVTHAGLLRLAARRHCAGIHSSPVLESSDPATSRWVFRATVFKSRTCKGFIGYGDADPSNVSPLVHGAEMRVAETRCQSCAAQGLRHRHLLGRGDRIIRRTGFFLSGVEEAPAPARQRELWRPQSPRPSLSAHPPAPTRCHPRQVLRHRFLRHQNPPRSLSRAGRKLCHAFGRLGRERPQCPALPAQ